MNATDKLDRVIALLEAMCKAQKITLPKAPKAPKAVAPPTPGWTIEGQKQLGADFAEVARAWARKRGVVEPEPEGDFPESTIANIDDWRRRR